MHVTQNEMKEVMAMKYNRVLHYSGGNSDKIYIIRMMNRDSTGSRPQGSNWKVITYWGRRGATNLQSKEVMNGCDKDMALAEMERIVSEKKFKGGYVDVEGAQYTGPVKITDPAIVNHLTPDNPKSMSEALGRESKVAKNGTGFEQKWKGKSVSLKCVDNLGMEELFDLGIEYVWETDPSKIPSGKFDQDMLWVYSKTGELIECLTERFEVIPK